MVVECPSLADINSDSRPVMIADDRKYRVIMANILPMSHLGTFSYVTLPT